MTRQAVDYYWPGTAAGDGRPLTGTAFYDAQTPADAWDEHVRRLRNGQRELEPWQEVVVRAYPADDLPGVRPMREIINAEGWR